MRRRALLMGDFRNVFRDGLMVLILVAPFLIAGGFRFGAPFVRKLLLPGFDLAIHYPFINTFLLLIPGMMLGAIIGFLLLDERDEQVLSFIAVTPLRLSGYLRFRTAMPVAYSAFFSIPVLLLSGLGEIDVVKTIPVVIMASLGAPMMALFLSSFAANKVEGMAVYKLAGIFQAGAFVAYFVTSDLQYLGGILPSFWVTKAYLSPVGIKFWLFIAAGVVVHLFYIFLFMDFFKKKNK